MDEVDEHMKQVIAELLKNGVNLDINKTEKQVFQTLKREHLNGEISFYS